MNHLVVRTAKIVKSVIAIVTVVGLMCACSGNDHSAIPRRHAYPRIAVPDSVYVGVDSFAPHFEVNPVTAVQRPKLNQLDIHYPAYDVTIYVTSRELDSGELITELDNRRERISLNLNGAAAVTEHFVSDNGEFECMLVRAVDASATPVQFMATDGVGRLVSGAAYFAHVDATSSADSLAPIVSFISRDVKHALRMLGAEP